MKRVKCKSGIMGYQEKLRKLYKDFNEWVDYANMFKLHIKLGYKNPTDAWMANPTVQGSVIPADYCKVE